MIPLRPGSPSQFATLRARLARAGYTESGVCGRAGVDRMYDYRSRRRGGSSPSDRLSDALDILIELFLEAEPVPAATARTLLPPGTIEALETVGLLTSLDPQDAAYAATASLYPTASLFIVSDLEAGGPLLDSLPDDCVYPAITPLCERFLEDLPVSPCNDLLDLGSGTGIGALVSARHARRAWAVDITERATRFAEFNARLNDIGNVTPLRGDLYEPVAGLDFDRIIAHPPFVPAPEHAHIFRDGGPDGEQVIRGVFAGLAEHLRPGGTLYCTCMMTDRRGAPIERRIRGMIGDRESEFDVVLVTNAALPPELHCARIAGEGEATLDESRRLLDTFGRLEVERVVHGSIVVRRHGAARPPLSLRRARGADTGVAEVEWLLRWEAALVEGDVAGTVLAARPRLSRHARLDVEHLARDDGWATGPCRVWTDYPFPAAIELPPATAAFLPRCDGMVPAPELLERMKAAGAAPPHAAPAEFAGILRTLLSTGLLESEAFRLPRSAAAGG